MSSFFSRSEYYKYVAAMNKLIAHNRPVTTGSDKLRMSFHRVNNQDEFDSAVVNWGHYPCVVHMGHSVRFKTAGIGIPHRLTESALRFLAKIDAAIYKNKADGMEAAYDLAFTAMLQYIAYLLQDKENDVCGVMAGFDLTKASAEQTGEVTDGVYGWDLIFYDDNKETGLTYNSADWFIE